MVVLSNTAFECTKSLLLTRSRTARAHAIQVSPSARSRANHNTLCATSDSSLKPLNHSIRHLPSYFYSSSSTWPSPRTGSSHFTASVTSAAMHPQRIEPAVGQESVWDYPRPPRLERTAKHIVIKCNGQIIADTRDAYRVLETSHPPVYYIPQVHYGGLEIRIVRISVATNYSSYNFECFSIPVFASWTWYSIYHSGFIIHRSLFFNYHRLSEKNIRITLLFPRPFGPLSDLPHVTQTALQHYMYFDFKCI